MPLPNFLVIGAAKSATTSLHRYLLQHPQIFMSSRKEPNFFAFEGATPSFLGPDDEGLPCPADTSRLMVAKYQQSIIHLKDYQRLFQRVTSEVAVGEASVSYLYFREAAGRIHRRIPDCRLIAILRNPVDRAYSKFLQFRRDGCEPLDDFAAALDAEAGRIERNWSPTWHYVGRGFYHRQLIPYFELFDCERIRVLLYDDFVEDPTGMMQDLFLFLGVDAGFRPDMTCRHNVSYQGSKRSLARLVNRGRLIPRLTRSMLPAQVYQPLKARLRRGQPVDRGPSKLPPGLLRERLVEHFRDDVVQLGRLLGRDLSAWLR